MVDRKILGKRAVTIEIPHLPDRDLSPNARVHWSERAIAAKVARNEAGWLAKEQWHDDKPMQKGKVSYVFTVPNHRRRDLDNLLTSCKPWQDGLIDAGVLFYDDSDHLEIGGVKLLRGIEEKTVITIEEL